jgi:tetratricopeptide (TPR) repeat protein
MEGGSMGIRRVILAVAASVLLVMAGCSETKIAMPEDTESEWMARGYDLLVAKEYQEAVGAYDKAIAMNAGNADAYYNRGISHYYLGNYEQSVADYESALRIHPGHQDAGTGRDLARKQLESAMSRVPAEEQPSAEPREAASESRPEAEEWYRKGYVLLEEEENPVDAEKAFDKAIALDAGYTDAYVQRGAARMAAYFLRTQGTYENVDITRVNQVEAMRALKPALSDIEKALELKPDNPEAYEGRAAVYMMTNQPREAIENLDRAIELAPKNAETRTTRGFMYLMLQQPERAIADFDKSIEIAPKYVMAYKNRGATYLGLNRYKEAVGDYDRFVELAPDDPEAYYGRGMAYIMGGKEKKGCPDFRKACDLGNCNGVAFAQVSGMCGMEGQMEAAMQDMMKQAQEKMEEMQRR